MQSLTCVSSKKYQLVKLHIIKVITKNTLEINYNGMDMKMFTCKKGVLNHHHHAFVYSVINLNLLKLKLMVKY